MILPPESADSKGRPLYPDSLRLMPTDLGWLPVWVCRECGKTRRLGNAISLEGVNLHIFQQRMAPDGFFWVGDHVYCVDHLSVGEGAENPA